jgi:hypothetical protein
VDVPGRSSPPDHFVQLRVVQPSILLGETAGLEVWTQNNPHGVFIALEEAGCLFMALAFPFAGVAVARNSRLERAARWVFFGGFGLVVGSLAGYLAAYGLHPEYRLEVAAPRGPARPDRRGTPLRLALAQEDRAGD